jgi:lipoprotein-releasing system ATP-binding protein
MANPEAPYLAEVLNADRFYGKGENRIRVLKSACLQISAGEFVAIVGPSGSGKSTLLNLLGALDRPSAGTVKIDGRDLSLESDDGLADIRNRVLGFIFQFHHLLPDFTALENVMFPARIAKRAIGPQDVTDATEMLERVGLGSKLKNRATDLSGGQQQRVAIARALAGGKKLILADEPTGNLDSVAGNDVFALMREFNARDGTAFVIVTHDEALAERADRIIRVVNGEVSG